MSYLSQNGITFKSLYNSPLVNLAGLVAWNKTFENTTNCNNCKPISGLFNQHVNLFQDETNIPTWKKRNPAMAGQQMNKALSPGEGGVRPTRIAQKTPHNRNKIQQFCPLVSS